MALPKLIFDTSALSAFAKDAALSEPYIKALNCGYDVLLTAMSVDELISAPVAGTREDQLACCQRLLVSGTCIWPPHEIMTRLAVTHANSAQGYDWRKVYLRAQAYEGAIIDRDFTAALSAENLNVQQQLEQEYMAYWQNLRVKLAPILDKDPSSRPNTFKEAIQIATSTGNNVLFGIGKGLYKRASTVDLSDAEIASFLDNCPPFRAACYGLCGAWFDVSLAERVFKKLAGRNDQMMSIYLPYCDYFVTRDKKQLDRLRDIAAGADTGCHVLSFEGFCSMFSVAATPSPSRA